MNQNKLLLIGGGLLLLFCVAVLSSMDSTEEAYVQQILAERARVLEAWKRPSYAPSPIPMSQRSSLRLAHYPPDPRYRLQARLLPAPAQPGTPRLAGWLAFELDGKPYRLQALHEPENGPNALFVPFFDATNRAETYPGGRYLNLSLGADSTVVLDFNYAHNPYCAYDAAAYTHCPVPPAENRLPIHIPAGEKRYPLQAP
ncbi:MAG: DUF1684 domain-containing protein [Bacteroidetes bacterium]|jgi:uncharacterized protein (DUF1684 family)|nr:DUF1684 domain-containing protein [Bacteroidota bacterium]